MDRFDPWGGLPDKNRKNRNWRDIRLDYSKPSRVQVRSPSQPKPAKWAWLPIMICVGYGVVVIGEFQPELVTELQQFLFSDRSPVVPISGGVVRSYVSNGARNPLRISAPVGNQSYFVRVIAEPSHIEAAAIFLSPGQIVTAVLDPGDYLLQIAVGEKWRGEAKYFGRETLFVQQIKPLNFKSSPGQFGGYVVDLKPTVVGNMPVKPISRDEF